MVVAGSVVVVFLLEGLPTPPVLAGLWLIQVNLPSRGRGVGFFWGGRWSCRL